MIDLHAHSLYSDGDFSPADLIKLAGKRGVEKIALTDHNTLVGINQQFIAGVEIFTAWRGAAVHILGYGRSWEAAALQAGLASTRAGYKQRIEKMVELCHQAGYNNVSLTDIKARRVSEAEPAFVSYDIVKELMAKHNLPLAQARALTLEGGACHVPYGSWAMSPAAAITLLHQVGGLAVLAHPGITGQEQGRENMWRLINEVVYTKINGLEVYHPFHDEVLKKELAAFCQKNNLLITGGSDFHGVASRDFLGQSGLSQEDWEKFQSRLSPNGL